MNIEPKKFKKVPFFSKNISLKTFHNGKSIFWQRASSPQIQLVAGSNESNIKIWNLNDGVCTKKLIGHHGSVFTLIKLKSGRLASGSFDNTIRIWDLDIENSLLKLEGHTNLVMCLCELMTGELVSGSYDSLIKIWDLNTQICTQTLVGHSSCVWNFAILSKHELLSCSDDKSIRYWNVKYGVCLKKLEDSSPIFDIIALANGEVISASNQYHRNIKIWDIKNEVCKKTLKSHTTSVFCLAILKENELISGSRDRIIKIWDLQKGIVLKSLYGHTDSIIYLSINSVVSYYHCKLVINSFDILASGSADKTIKLWNMRNGSSKSLNCQHSWTECLAFI
jgi:WD40 repeat protein